LLSCNEFNQINIDLDARTVEFRANFVRPLHVVMASSLHCYTDMNLTFKHHHDYFCNMSYHSPISVDTEDGLHHSKAIQLRSSDDNGEQVRKVTKIIEDNAYLDNGTIDALNVIVAELFSNFYDHAESDQPPICCVQSWDNGFVEIAIADRGIGIAKSLKEIMIDYPKQNPCRIACQNEISSKYGQNHSGYGLFYTKRFIEENKGRLFLLSGKNCYSIEPSGEKDMTFNVGWKGTIIRLVINKKVSIASENFFQMIAREQGGDDCDDFF
jgi:anti-sigma regulatory factor (Ser/Thr protein kinase)